MRTDERSVLIIVQNLPAPFDRRVWLEATTIQRAGYGVAVICPKGKAYSASYEEIEGIRIYRYSTFYEASKGVVGYLFEFLYCWLATLWLAIRAYTCHPFQVIHACNPPDTYFALAFIFRLAGVKFVFDHHDLCPEMYVAKGHRKGVLYRGLLGLERLTLRTADAVIAVNESHKEVAIRRGGIAESKVTVVRSGPRLAWSEPVASCSPLRLGHGNIVLYLGEMCEQDGVGHLLHVIQDYQTRFADDTLFVLVGGGPDQPRMKRMAANMGLAAVVQFTGRIPDDQLKEYLSMADVCVDPDPFTEWSNLSTMNKMIEYMAFGKPIVAFDLKEHKRTAGAAAIYITPNDDQRFSAAIRELIIDTAQRNHMGRIARQRFENQLAWEHSERALLSLYYGLLESERTSLDEHIDAVRSRDSRRVS
jgi:glycosyltransferase involved in cell wall biosynthesis